MPQGYLVSLGDVFLNTGDSIATSRTNFSTDTTLGVGTWSYTATQGQTTTSATETGVY